MRDGPPAHEGLVRLIFLKMPDHVRRISGNRSAVELSLPSRIHVIELGSTMLELRVYGSVTYSLFTYGEVIAERRAP